MRVLTNLRISSGKRDGILLKVTLLLLGFLFVCSCGLHLYSRYMAQRALYLLAEAKTINVGSGEESVLPLVARFRGTKWYPSSAQAEDKCKIENQCQGDGSARDFSYDMRLSPFHVFSTQDGARRSHTAIAFLMGRLPNFLRDPLGLRDWLVVVNVHIQDGHIAVVSGNAFVEGRHGWLGNSWVQSLEPSGMDDVSSAYSIDMSHLEFPPRGGLSLKESMTPTATVEQVQSSFEMNSHCLTGLIPCATLCNFKPSIFAYLKAHPEISVNFETASCLVPKS